MRVTLHTPKTIYSPRHIPTWLLLAGAAGFVNAFAFLSCEQFVTHVTGTATRVGLEFLHVGLAAEYAVVLLSFLVGAAAAVVITQMRARAGGSDRWSTPILAVSILLALAALLGELGAFGPFGGNHASDPPPALMLSLLAFAMGLQNASVASTTALAIRTTHLTGPTTDAGMLLGAAWLSDGAERRAALSGAALRGLKVLAFIFGAGLSLQFSGLWGYVALLVPAGMVLAASALSFVPEWGPSDFPFRLGEETAHPEGLLAALPADARPLREGPGSGAGT